MKVPSQKILQMKKEVHDEVVEMIKKYDVVAAADLRKVKSFQIQEIRKKLRDRLWIKTVKNNIIRMAAESLKQERKNIVEFSSLLTGPFSLIFTDMNPYNLIILLDKNKVKVHAKEGDVATGDIIVPAGNTGLPPGPLISEFNDVGVQTRIEEGSIWIARDALVAKKGEVISRKLVSVLSRLGIKPMEAGLSLLAAYDNGSVLSPEDLTFDLGEVRNSITDALKKSMNLAVYSNYMTEETATPILSKAYRQAYWVALKAEFPTPETIPETIRRAYSIAANISNRIPSVDKTAKKSKEPDSADDQKETLKKEE